MIADRILEGGPARLVTEANKLTICSQDPTTYTEANATYAVAFKNTPTITIVDGAVSGRAAQVAAITDGTVNPGGGDSEEFWALVDTANSRLLATGPITNDQVLTNGNTFTLALFIAYEVRDPS